MNKPNIVLSIAAADEAFARMERALGKIANVRTVGLDGFSLAGADIFIGKQLDEKTLATADRLKAVFAYKTGADGFPVAALAPKGVTLCNSHVNSKYIAEYAFSLAATLVARTAEFDRAMRNGDWRVDDPYWRSVFEMKIGLLGYGGIGRALHGILLRNGIPAYTVDRGKTYKDIAVVKTVDELCEECDLIVLSLPQTPDTDKIIDARRLELLSGKYLVNVGRSNCIDEPALYASLKNGELAGAAIDTWREKQRDKSVPLKPFDVPFDKLDNIVLSSHKAMQVKLGHDRYVDDTLDNVTDYINGKPPRNVVDLKKGY